MSDGERIDDLIEAYEQTALRWEDLRPEASAANEVFEKNHAIYKELRILDKGRAGIARLMAHESEAVRLIAATHSLAWEPETATSALEAIERAGGLNAVTAKWTLRTYRGGNLDLDW